MDGINFNMPQPTQAAPELNVLTQYLKDLSFENAHAPESLSASDQEPEVSIQVHVDADQVEAGRYEVRLRIDGSAFRGEMNLFRVEVEYVGLFELKNIPEQDIHPLLMIECPRLLFPYTRQIVSESVRGGGFPPLMLAPIDFVALYKQRLQEVLAEENGSETVEGASRH